MCTRCADESDVSSGLGGRLDSDEAACQVNIHKIESPGIDFERAYFFTQVEPYSTYQSRRDTV